jgi:hypothetical protein
MKLEEKDSYLVNFNDGTGGPELEQFAINLIQYFLGFNPNKKFFAGIFDETCVYATRPGSSSSKNEDQTLKIWFAPFLGLRIETKNLNEYLFMIFYRWASDDQRSEFSKPRR